MLPFLLDIIFYDQSLSSIGPESFIMIDQWWCLLWLPIFTLFILDSHCTSPRNSPMFIIYSSPLVTFGQIDAIYIQGLVPFDLSSWHGIFTTHVWFRVVLYFKHLRPNLQQNPTSNKICWNHDFVLVDYFMTRAFGLQCLHHFGTANAAIV